MALVVKQRRKASFLDPSAVDRPVPERELSMIADRMGRWSQPQRSRFTAPAMAPVELGLLDHAYLLLIDRENPLSSMSGRP